MDGRGTGAEDTLNKINRLKKERNGSEDQEEAVDVRNDFQGELSSVVPDEIFIPMKKDDVSTPEVHDTGQVLIDPDRLATMDVQYRTLFAEGGFEILREFADGSHLHSPDSMGSEDYNGTLELLAFHGMVDRNGAEACLTQKGESIYSNWRGFEDYLVSDERIQDIEGEIGDVGMPEFLASWGIDTDLDSFLRDRSGHRSEWQRDHNPDGELYDITRPLYGSDEFGYGLIALEDAKNGNLNDPELLEGVGIRGILDGDELNQDGEKLYNKVLADYLLRQ